MESTKNCPSCHIRMGIRCDKCHECGYDYFKEFDKSDCADRIPVNPNQSMVEGETVEQAADKYSIETIMDTHRDCYEERLRTAAKFKAGAKWQKSKSTSENEKLKADSREFREDVREEIVGLLLTVQAPNLTDAEKLTEIDKILLEFKNNKK